LAITWFGGGSNGSIGVFARRFDQGNPSLPLGDQFQVSDPTGNPQGHPSVGMDQGGNFVVAWEALEGLFAKRFDNCTGPVPPGSFGCTPALGNQFQANSTIFTFHRPTVGMGPRGDFVIAWDGLETSTISTNLIAARRFDASQTPQGNEFRVNEVPRDSFRPAAAMDGGGDFVVAWDGASSGGSFDVFARRFVPRRALSIDDVRVAPGNSGTTDATFTVTLSAASNETVSVDFATADGTALAGTDYDANLGTLNFAPGEFRKSIAVHVHGVPLRQTYETFFVNLSNVRGSNATIAKTQGRGTITNDQPPLTLSIADVTLTKPISGTSFASFTVTLSAASTQTVTVDFATADGTAIAGTHYVSQSGTLFFQPTETLKTISIVVNGNTTVEPDKTFFVNLSNPVGATIAKTQGVGTIKSVARIVVNETITVTDVPNVLQSAMIGIAEIITVTDTPGVRPSAMIGVNENIAVADATQVFDTATGTNIFVKPVDRTTGASPVSITFSNVTQAGNTTLTTSASGPAPPSGFSLGNPPVYFDISTTASFTGTATVCISYSGIIFIQPPPHLLHLENGSWVDHTTSIDPVNMIVCGTVTSFSPFALFAPLPVLMITANGASRPYGQANPALNNVTYNGFINGDTPSALSGTLSCVSPATPASPVGNYPITCTGLTSANYTINYASGLLTITQAALTVTANNAARLYGSPNPAFSASASGLVNGDTLSSIGATPTCSTPATAASPVGSYTITCTGPASATNYTIAYQPGTLTITPAPLTITANNATKILHSPNPPFSASYSGFVNGDTPASLTGTLTCTTTATTASDVGSYPITCSGQSSTNYAITYVAGTLKILYATAIGHVIQPPINADGTSVFKQGRTIPAKFAVFAANGVSIGTPGVVSSFLLTAIVSGTTTTVVEDVVDTNNPDTAFRWDGQEWIFNITTGNLPAGSTYVYTITLNDGSTIIFQYGLR